MTNATVPDAIAALPPLRDVIARYDLGARKKLGQHFLLDLNLTGRIARAAGDISRGTVIEVGPGPGGLTRALLMADAARVITVEQDSRCIEALADLTERAAGRLEIVEGDALDIDIASLGKPPRRIVANLPYNISVPLLIAWLEKADRLASMMCMFQKEVAERIVAKTGNKSYGRLAVLSNWRCRTRKLFDIPARAFTPPPKVVSTVVELVPYEEPPYPCDMTVLQAITAAAFGQRRKMLRRSLGSLGVETEALLETAEVDPTARAENLNIEQFAALARALASLRASP